ncbi:MAG TPA: hypothetical protein VGG77_01915 [Roseiarcus sp.]|jgi:hypothetical protein
MDASYGARIALAFILAVPLFARPALGAPAHELGHKPAHYRATDFAAATALASPPAPIVDAHKTDGLSRKDEDCSRGGCIDH